MAAEDVAAVPPQSPLSDDVELEEFFGRTRTQQQKQQPVVPALILRKDSTSAGAAVTAAGDVTNDCDDDADASADGTGLRLHTPAPIALFEVLSDVDESDMDDVTSLDAQSRDANFDLTAAGSGVKGHAAAADNYNNYDDNAKLVQANGTVMETTHHVDVDDVIESRDEHLVPGITDVPTLVFEDIDADKPNQMSSPEECPEIVNNDNDNDVQQQMWQWTADQDQEAGWVTFDEIRADDDQTVPSSYQQPEDEDQEQEAKEEDDEMEKNGRAERPPSSVSAAASSAAELQQQSQKTRDEIAMEQALAKYSAQLELDAMEEDDDAPFHDKKKSKIKLPFSTKKIIKNVKEKTSGKDKSTSKEPPSDVKQPPLPALNQEPVARVQHYQPSPEVQAKMADSEEWKAFQAMQERISQMVSQTSEKVSQMEQGFEDELSKLSAAASQSASPWAVPGVDGTVTSPPTVKSPSAGGFDKDDQKSASWVGFEDTFDAGTAAETASNDDDVTAAAAAEPSGSQQVESSQPQANSCDEQVSFDDVMPPPPPPAVSDVISRHSEESQQQRSVAAENDDVAIVTNVAATDTVRELSMSAAEAEGPRTEPVPTTTSPESRGEKERQPTEVAVEETSTTGTVDPFDVSNVVTAMKSDKPIFEVLSTEDRERGGGGSKQEMPNRKTVEERRERDRQLTAAMIGADGSEARSRPRPRPQAAVKSANPFKITLAATSIEPADDEAVDDGYDVNDAYTTATTTFSAANPFARAADLDESETTAATLDSGIWDPFSDADATTFTATFDFDEQQPDESTKARDKETDSQSSKSSFEEPEETLEPLDPFYPPWDGKGGWSMFLRTPLKKKLTQNRAWKPVFVRLCEDKDAARVRVYTSENESTCLHEMTLGITFALRQMQLQQFDQYTKCHTVKLQHVFYVEKLALKSDRIAPTLRDVTKVRDLKGLKDLVHKPKTTMLLSHSPQATESLKFGTLDLVAYKQFIRAIEDTLFVQKAPQRGKMATSYTKDEIRVDLFDEYYADIDYTGHISYHKARVRLFCITFLTGNPVVEIGINDKKRRGNEIVGRADIIPIKTEDWIRYEDVELHDIVDKDEYEKTRLIKFRPPDASRFEVMRFRVRPRANVELPLQIGVQMSVMDRRIEIRADVMIPGYFSTSRRASQVACENIQIRFPIPETLVYMFRVEKRFRYGSVHSSKKKPGRIKGLERLTMFATGGSSGSGSGGGANAVPTTTPIVLQASSGLAKYEHLHRAVVWRISRLPERNQGAYKTHLFVLKLELGPHDTPPTDYAKHIHVEYTLSNSLVSRAQVRSVSLSGQYYEEPPDRWVRHVARYEYSVEVEFTDQLRAPTQTEAPDLDDIFSASASRRHYDDDDSASAGGATPGSATASGSESTADESSDSSDSD